MHPIMKSAVACLAVACLAASHARAAEAPRPNIVFFLIDDMGWQDTSLPFHREVTELNRRYHTPNMERMAAQGMKFTQAYASAVCSPSRISAITGMNAARHQVTNWTLRKDQSPDPVNRPVHAPPWNRNGLATAPGTPHTVVATPLPALLRQAGYRTIHAGKAHFGAKDCPGETPLALGFEVNIAGHCAGGPGSYHGLKNFSGRWRKAEPIWDVPGLERYHGKDIFLTEAITEEAVNAVESAVADRKPFYLYLSHYAIHAPLERDDRFYQRYLDQGLKPADATLASMIEGMDKSLGDVMAALERLGVANNTVILFMSDNGSASHAPINKPLRGHKLLPYEGGIRVPMIASWPGRVKPGASCRETVLIEDFFPTILDLAGAAWRGRTIQPIDGISFLPMLDGKPAPDASRAFIWHYPHTYDRPPHSIIRQGPWKLIFHPASRRTELFNIDEDIGETRDLASQEPRRTAELSQLLAARLNEMGASMPIDRETGDPVPFPAAATTAPGR